MQMNNPLPTAKDALSKAIENKNRMIKEQMKTISKIIYEAINKGETSCTFYDFIYPENRSILENKPNNYYLTGKDLNEPEVTIYWSLDKINKDNEDRINESFHSGLDKYNGNKISPHFQSINEDEIDPDLKEAARKDLDSYNSNRKYKKI